VAAYASRLRGAERAADMATLASNIRVCTIQLEAGAEMVKSLLRPGRGGHGKTEEGCQEFDSVRDLHCSDLTFLKESSE
jgi:hypothetical protein